MTELNKCMNLYENGVKLWHRVMKSNIKSFWKRIRSHHFLSAHRVVGYRTMQAAYHSSCRFGILRLCLACGSCFRWNREERSVYVCARLTARKRWAVESCPVLRISMWSDFEIRKGYYWQLYTISRIGIHHLNSYDSKAIFIIFLSCGILVTY